MAASESKLSVLHELLAEELARQVQGDELPPVLDEETGEVIEPARRLPPSASVLTVAAKFLKDNNITSTPEDDNALAKLKEAMEERRQRREARKTDLVEASKDMGFLTGLPN